MPLSKYSLDARPGHGLVFSFSSVYHSLSCQLYLFRFQPTHSGVARQIGEGIVCWQRSVYIAASFHTAPLAHTPHSHRESYHSVKNEQPPPTSQARRPIHTLIERGLQVPTEHGPNECACKENRSPLRQLLLRVPSTKDRMNSRIESSFSEPNEESTSIKLMWCFNSRSCKCHNDPDHLPRWAPE